MIGAPTDIRLRLLEQDRDHHRRLAETYRNTLDSLTSRLATLADRGETIGPDRLRDLSLLLADELDADEPTDPP